MAQQKTVLVTGAANGIGRAIALKFARDGYKVGAYDIDVAALEKLLGEAGAGTEIVTGSMDVRNVDDWELSLEQLCGPDGTLDVLINNAGILHSGRFADISLADQTRTIEINVLGTMNGCHTAYPYLKRAGEAQVINLCSASAIYGQMDLAAYSASKFAVRGLTEALELEWQREGIKVNALWPLFVNTNMVEGMNIGTTRALGVRLTPDDVARAAFKVAQGGRGGVHRGVGVQARTMMASANPSGAGNRLVNKILGNR